MTPPHPPRTRLFWSDLDSINITNHICSLEIKKIKAEVPQNGLEIWPLPAYPRLVPHPPRTPRFLWNLIFLTIYSCWLGMNYYTKVLLLFLIFTFNPILENKKKKFCPTSNKYVESQPELIAHLGLFYPHLRFTKILDWWWFRSWCNINHFWLQLIRKLGFHIIVSTHHVSWPGQCCCTGRFCDWVINRSEHMFLVS